MVDYVILPLISLTWSSSNPQNYFNCLLRRIKKKIHQSIQNRILIKHNNLIQLKFDFIFFFFLDFIFEHISLRGSLVGWQLQALYFGFEIFPSTFFSCSPYTTQHTPVKLPKIYGLFRCITNYICKRYMYRVFIKYCVKNIRTLAFLSFPSLSVCVHIPGRQNTSATELKKITKS